MCLWTISNFDNYDIMTKCTKLFIYFDANLQYLYCLCELKIHIMITKHIIYQTCIEFMQATIISSFYKTFQNVDIIYDRHANNTYQTTWTVFIERICFTDIIKMCHIKNWHLLILTNYVIIFILNQFSILFFLLFY